MRSFMSLLLGVSYVFWSVAMVVDQPAVGVSDLGASVAAATMGGCSMVYPCKQKTPTKACDECHTYGDKWYECKDSLKGYDCTSTSQPGYNCTLSGEMICSDTGKEYENPGCQGVGKTIEECKLTVANGTTCP